MSQAYVSRYSDNFQLCARLNHTQLATPSHCARSEGHGCALLISFVMKNPRHNFNWTRIVEDTVSLLGFDSSSLQPLCAESGRQWIAAECVAIVSMVVNAM